MVGVIWYRFVRCGGTDWSDTLVPIRPLQWYRLKRYIGTDSSATVVPIRRYYHVEGEILENSVVTILICRCQCGFGNRLASYAKKFTLGIMSLQSYHNVSQTFTI